MDAVPARWGARSTSWTALEAAMQIAASEFSSRCRMRSGPGKSAICGWRPKPCLRHARTFGQDGGNLGEPQHDHHRGGLGDGGAHG